MGQSYEPQQQTTIQHDEDIAHEAVHQLGDNFGYGTILLFIGIGALFMFKKKISKAVKSFLGIRNGKLP